MTGKGDVFPIELNEGGRRGDQNTLWQEHYTKNVGRE